MSEALKAYFLKKYGKQRDKALEDCRKAVNTCNFRLMSGAMNRYISAIVDLNKVKDY